MAQPVPTNFKFSKNYFSYTMLRMFNINAKKKQKNNGNESADLNKVLEQK